MLHWLTRRNKRAAQGLRFAGRSWGWSDLCRHVLFMGGTGMGKTFASTFLLRELMRAGCPMLFVTVKPDDFGRVVEIAKSVGHGSRVVEITPDGEHRMNLLDRLLAPDGSASNASELLAKIARVGQPKRTSDGSAQFWETHGKRCTEAAITLCREVLGKATITDVHRVATSAPMSLEDARTSPEWDDKKESDKDGNPIHRGRCAELVVMGLRKGLKSRNFLNATAYLTQELAGGGNDMRGGILANVNNSLGYFLNDPWVNAFSSDTTLTPQKIDEERLIGVLSYPMMIHFQAAKLWQFAWTMEAARHCMRRPYVKGTPPFVIPRDEVGWVLNSEWDQSVCIVARSQGLMFVDSVQDISTLLTCLGNEAEADSFLANHMGAKVMLATEDLKTAQWMSSLVGQKKSIMISSGGGQDPHADWMSQMLGATSCCGWSESWQPILRPEEFTRMPVGYAAIQAFGELFFHDFTKEK